MTDAPSSLGAAAVSAAPSLDAAATPALADKDGINLADYQIHAVGERDAMSVNMRNAGLEQLNEKYMTHLRNTMRRDFSLINMDQRSLLNRFNSYSMTKVSASLAPTSRDRRTYLDYLKARQQRADETCLYSMQVGQQEQLTRARTFIESQRVGDPGCRPEGVSMERLKLLTRPARPYQTVCPRLKVAPVRQECPECVPSLRRARVKTAPTPSYLLRLHYQRVEEERLRQALPNERRAHSTLGFSVQDATLRRRALGDVRFVQLRETLVPPKQPQRSPALEPEDL